MKKVKRERKGQERKRRARERSECLDNYKPSPIYIEEKGGKKIF